jgi:hypothetical protein
MNPALRQMGKKEASTFWQFACGNVLIGEYLQEKLNQTDDGSCELCLQGSRARTHLFCVCKALITERKLLWAQVAKACQSNKKPASSNTSGNPKPNRQRLAVRTLFSRESCTEAVLKFLETTKIRRRPRRNLRTATNLQTQRKICQQWGERKGVDREMEGRGALVGGAGAIGKGGLCFCFVLVCEECPQGALPRALARGWK